METGQLCVVADDVVLVAASVAVVEVMVEVIAMLNDVGLTVGAQKIHRTSHPKMVGCVVGGSLGVCGIEGVSAGWCKTCNRTQNSSSQQVSGEIEISCILHGLQLMRLNIVKTTMWQVSFGVLGVWTIKAHRGKIVSWSARMVENVISVKKPLAQNWSSVDREGQPHERVDCYPRTYAQLGWSCCQNGPQRSLCESLEMPRSSMVEMETASLERSKRKINCLVGTHNKSTLGTRHGCWASFQIHSKCRLSVGICPRQHRQVARKQFSKCGKSLVQMVPGTSGTQARPA